MKKIQEKMKKDDIVLIFNKIKSHYGLKTDAELAEFLNVSPSALGNCKQTGSLNWWNIIIKCEDMSIDELIGRTPKNFNGIHQNTVNGCNSNNINVINIDDRILRMYEESQKQNSDLIEIIKNISNPKSNCNE